MAAVEGKRLRSTTIRGDIRHRHERSLATREWCTLSVHADGIVFVIVAEIAPVDARGYGLRIGVDRVFARVVDEDVFCVRHDVDRSFEPAERADDLEAAAAAHPPGTRRSSACCRIVRLSYRPSASLTLTRRKDHGYA